MKNDTNRVSVCHKDSCLHAKGGSATVIASGIFTILLFIGISHLISNSAEKKDR